MARPINTKTANLTLALSPEDKRRLAALAEDARQSASAWVATKIDKAWKRRKEQ